MHLLHNSGQQCPDRLERQSESPPRDIRRDAVSCRRTGGHHAGCGSVQRPPRWGRARCRHRLAIGAARCASQRGTRDVERLSDRGGDPRARRADRIGPARIRSLWSLSAAGTFAWRHNANLARANACSLVCFDIITPRARIVEFSPRKSVRWRRLVAAHTDRAHPRLTLEVSRQPVQAIAFSANICRGTDWISRR